MSPKKRARTQQPQMVMVERMLALQQLQSNLQPSQEGPDAERAKSLG